jgi:hypothetical protein
LSNLISTAILLGGIGSVPMIALIRMRNLPYRLRRDHVTAFNTKSN